MVFMKQFLLILVFALLFPLAFAAVSSQDAVNYVANSTEFLMDNEYAEISPNVKIAHESKAYWVVGIIMDGSPTGFIPITDDSILIPESKITRKELIETAYFLRSFSQIKNSAVQQEQWVFTTLNFRRMEDLAIKLQSEISLDLTTIESEVSTNPEILGLISAMKSDLGLIHPKTNDLAQDLVDISSFENSFSNNPDTATLDVLKEKLGQAFLDIEDLNEKKIQYLIDVEQLKQAIAQTGLPIQTKQSLAGLASAPAEFAYLSSISASSTNLSEAISQAFDDSLARSQILADNLDTRIRHNNAYQIMFGQDNEIIEKTKENNLSNLVNLILSESYVWDWENQEEVAFLRENWKKATSYYDNGNYETAMTFADKSKKNALRVYEDGLKEPEPVINIELLVTSAVIIIVALIIIHLIRSRGKFARLFSGQEEGEKFEFED
ncbi:MAG: hypothetical protein JW772_01345 [Candidatus Diapherotrites archaeon]|nr:hypothetical protein [Candidatus Diapherotrites archaeon]